MDNLKKDSIVTITPVNFDLLIKCIRNITNGNCTIRNSELISIKDNYTIKTDLSPLFNGKKISISFTFDKQKIRRLKAFHSNFDIMIQDKGDYYHFCTNDYGVKLKKMKPNTKESFKVVKKHSKVMYEGYIEDGHEFNNQVMWAKDFELHFKIRKPFPRSSTREIFLTWT